MKMQVLKTATETELILIPGRDEVTFFEPFAVGSWVTGEVVLTQIAGETWTAMAPALRVRIFPPTPAVAEPEEPML